MKNNPFSVTEPFFLIVCLLLGFVSCENKPNYEFSPSDIAFLKPFRAGDSLFFKNQKGLLDTIVITKIDIQFVERRNSRSSNNDPEGKDVIVHAVLSDSDTTFLDKNAVRPKFVDLVTIRKYKDKEDAKLYAIVKGIVCNHSYIPLPLYDTIRLNDMMLTKYISVYAGMNRGFHETLYFTYEDGLVGYEKDGDIWNRIYPKK
jgi:hypothetical protein